MRKVRQAISEDRLLDLHAEFYSRYRIPNQEVRHEQRARRRASVLNQFAGNKATS
jgi:hypothetical protein